VDTVHFRAKSSSLSWWYRTQSSHLVNSPPQGPARMYTQNPQSSSSLSFFTGGGAGVEDEELLDDDDIAATFATNRDRVREG